MTESKISCIAKYRQTIDNYYGCIANIYRDFFDSEIFQSRSKTYCKIHKLGDCKTNAELFLCYYAKTGGVQRIENPLDLHKLDNKTFGIFLRSIFPSQDECESILTPFLHHKNQCIDLIRLGTKYSLQARALNELCEDINIEDKVFGVLFDTNLESL